MYVKHYPDGPRTGSGDDLVTWDIGVAAEEVAICNDIINTGTKVGSGTVGGDDKVSVTFTVTVPTFGTGAVGAEGRNYLCMVDGDGARADTDVEQFELEPSIRVVPSEVTAGDKVTVFAQDFTNGLTFDSVKLSGQTIPTASVSSTNTSGDGEATATFIMPGNYAGIIRVDASWGGISKDTKITTGGAELSLSRDEVLPNQSITIRGTDFSTDTNGCTGNDITSIEIDGKPMMLEDNDNINTVSVSNAGQFVFTGVIATTDNARKPVTAGKHTIEVVDCQDYTGSATFTVKEPTITVTPDVAGPRDTVVISGANWPVDNDKGASVRDVEVEIDFGSQNNDNEDAEPDVNGNFRITCLLYTSPSPRD